ncbi:MAG: hypothetical protein N2557_04730 [Hydrogenophilus sp.]|nr:hypothetical protein [Hydrogenophilus sp.]
MSTPHTAQTLLIPGPIGPIECLIDYPSPPPRGLAIIAHPHPLYGGTNQNKVVHTLARAYLEAGYWTLRPNFRGVGGSAGEHDHGHGETDDLLALILWASAQHPLHHLLLAGFSFGAHVMVRLARRLLAAESLPSPLPGLVLRHLTLVALPHGLTLGSGIRYDTPPLPPDLPALIIHGAEDTIVPLAHLFAWARPQNHPLTIFPGADHFFHGHLPLLKTTVLERLSCLNPSP